VPFNPVPEQAPVSELRFNAPTFAPTAPSFTPGQSDFSFSSSKGSQRFTWRISSCLILKEGHISLHGPILSIFLLCVTLFSSFSFALYLYALFVTL
jgi:hypothetical protein